MVPFGRAVAARTHRRVVMACAAQSGKTDTILDIIGQRFDQAPGPTLYVGPNKQFLNEQFEPRIMGLFDESRSLRDKISRGKRSTKTRKVISGVPLRLAHAGSSTALKSDPAALALTDEADELMANVKGQGDPITLVDRRGDTYADFVHAIVSTCSTGPKEVEVDPETKLEFWALQEPDDIDSVVWKLWQEGTRFHWAWPCPHCDEFFIPRFDRLSWPKNATPAHAKQSAVMTCAACGCDIKDDPSGDDLKATMNARGAYVAKTPNGVCWLFQDGRVEGEFPASETISFWVSGLCSPFKTFGERASEYLDALRSGDNGRIQTVVNGGFGELWSPVGGDAPEWEEVRRRSLGTYYSVSHDRYAGLPPEIAFLTLGADVQKNRIPYVIRGWGARQESWLVDYGELWGETHLEQVWTDLADLLSKDYDGLHISKAFVDAGFRPGKKDLVPEHMVYEFARANARQVSATKGFEKRETPVSTKRIDVQIQGKVAKYGLDLVRLDTDFLKSWVHTRIRWPGDQPGAWHLPAEITEDYCRQIVSEARARKPTGGFMWVQRGRDNHFLDAEALAFGAAYMLGAQRTSDQAIAAMVRQRSLRLIEANAPKPKAPPPRGRDAFLGDRPRGSFW